jgi:pantoate--beta-alanine ligase
VFVNPRQFAAHEDLGTYPRTWEADLDALTAAGADFVFAPPTADIYPPHRSPSLMPYVDLADADRLGEGGARPGFFRGVATVVAKLLNIVEPEAAYFGAKDGMQCIVVRRLIDDLDFNVRLVVGPTVREADGLAMSSRNVYLSKAERKAAPAVYAALCTLGQAYERGERSPAALRALAAQVVGSESLLRLQYLSFASCEDGAELTHLGPAEAGAEAGGGPAGSSHGVLASIAVQVGTTRLIDNIVLP